MNSQRIDEESNDIPETEEDTSCFQIFPKRLCHPSYALHRYFVLFFMCMLGFGNVLTNDSFQKLILHYLHYKL